MTTLDGVERTFDAETVLVCDRNGPSGIAGIMGGQTSEVSEATTRVLLEVACWNGTNILRSSRLLGLRSEASSRFEKQLHPELTMRAQAIASRLLVELCGAKLVPGTIDVAAEVPAPRRLILRASRVTGLLGMEISQDEQRAYLQRLGFEAEPAGEDLEVVVPPDRHYDVTREVDLIEEVARVHGIDEHLPTTLPSTGRAVGGLSREQRLRRRAEDGLRDLGFDQIGRLELHRPRRGRAAADPGADDPRADPILLANPLSEEQSAMRTTLLGSLLDVAARNLARGAGSLALFESTRVYLQTDGQPEGRVGRPAGRPVRRRSAGAVLRAAPVRRDRGRAAGASLLARRRRAGRLLRGQGRARGAGGAARRRARVRARRAAVPPPGPLRRRLGRRRGRRLAR